MNELCSPKNHPLVSGKTAGQGLFNLKIPSLYPRSPGLRISL